jgi:hypothetical protein
MSRSTHSNDASLSTIEPAPDGSGKGLRTDPKAEAGGGGGVFRLDALAPGAAAAGADAFAAGSGKTKLSHTALFFFVLVVAGGGMLFFMRQIGIGPMASFAKMKTPDYDVTKDLKGKSGDHKRVLKDLSESSVRTQVPIEQVQKNPFKLAEMLNTPIGEGENPEEIIRRKREQEKREREGVLRKVEVALSGLKVHSIIGGSSPVARINDKVFRVGETVEEVFTVLSIEGRSVTLESEAGEHVLSIDDGNLSPTAPRRK